MNVYQAPMSDSKAKRAETVDSLPDAAEMWHTLRCAYGARLRGATVVAVIADDDKNCIVQTLTVQTPLCTWPACGCKRGGSEHECAQGYPLGA